MPYTLKDKLVITGEITLVTGMHIGASNDFSPIGAVDSVVVRDPPHQTAHYPRQFSQGEDENTSGKNRIRQSGSCPNRK